MASHTWSSHRNNMHETNEMSFLIFVLWSPVLRKLRIKYSTDDQFQDAGASAPAVVSKLLPRQSYKYITDNKAGEDLHAVGEFRIHVRANVEACRGLLWVKQGSLFVFFMQVTETSLRIVPGRNGSGLHPVLSGDWSKGDWSVKMNSHLCLLLRYSSPESLTELHTRTWPLHLTIAFEVSRTLSLSCRSTGRYITSKSITEELASLCGTHARTH